MEDMEVTFWKDRNVLVTGATGLLGSWLVDELLGQGASVSWIFLIILLILALTLITRFKKTRT